MARKRLSLSPSAFTEIDEASSRVPSSDPEGGSGASVEFQVPNWIYREFRKLFDTGKYPTWETLADGYRFIFVEGLQNLMGHEVKPGFFKQLRLVQTILDDAAAETWGVRYLNQLETRVGELAQKGDHERIKAMLERHVHTLMQTEGTLQDIARASDLAAELHRRYRQYLEHPERRLSLVLPADEGETEDA